MRVRGKETYLHTTTVSHLNEGRRVVHREGEGEGEERRQGERDQIGRVKRDRKNTRHLM